MAYTVYLRSAAERERRRLQDPIRQRINQHLLHLESEPRPLGIEKLVGRPNSWRIRVGDYRILYEIDDANLASLVVETHIDLSTKAGRKHGLNDRVQGRLYR